MVVFAVVTPRPCCHLGELFGERTDLLVEAVEGFQEDCLPGGSVVNGVYAWK